MHTNWAIAGRGLYAFCSEGYIDARRSKAHWTRGDATGGYMMEENPQATAELVTEFLAK
jgi:hypothetical protein